MFLFLKEAIVQLPTMVQELTACQRLVLGAPDLLTEAHCDDLIRL